MIQEQLYRMSSHINGDEGDTAQDEPITEYDVYVEPDRITFIKREPKTIDASIPAPKSDNEAAPLLSNRASSVLAFCTISIYFFLILFCLLFQLYLFLNAPTALVLITPQEHTISTTTMIQVHSRSLQPLTLSQSQTVPATGKGHQDAERATGSITFYNGLYTSQTIASGTVLTGQSGIPVIIDQSAAIPPANPPYIGQVTVAAHALNTGSQGNIAAYDINRVCCSTGIKAVNTQPFTGGQNERNFTFVTRDDISQVAKTLKTSLAKIEGEALNSQRREGEALITPLCSQSVTSDHQPMEEAKDVTVTVSETCKGVAYNAHEVYAIGTRMIQERASATLGAGYKLAMSPQVTLLHTQLFDNTHVTIHVNVTGTFVYKFTQAQSQEIIHLIAGKSPEAARRILDHVPGIQNAAFTFSGTTLPKNTEKIVLIVQG